MSSFLEILVIAFVAQLAVLPGEKVQFIIAGLATRYNPYVVVAAASSAFAGWTVLELVVGQALTEVLTPLVLDLLTGGLFALFAVALFRSAPAADATHRSLAAVDGIDIDEVTILGWTPPERLGTFVPIFLLMAAGEFGDKTQLVTIGLAVQYGAHPAIWAGEMLAIIPVSLANALLVRRFAARIDRRWAHFGAAALFGFFALDTVLALTVGVSIWETVVGGFANAIVGALSA
jgi:putative Ca2+/H+ antiporter (TMEM165/GDT1 family)